MKKSMVNSFNIDEALQDGINEFGRLSGYNIRIVTPQKLTQKKVPLFSKALQMLLQIKWV